MDRRGAISRMMSSGMLPAMPGSGGHFAGDLSESSRSRGSASRSTRPNLPGAVWTELRRRGTDEFEKKFMKLRLECFSRAMRAGEEMDMPQELGNMRDKTV